MNKTKIEWCDSTWNPVTGCRHDCPYCYARKLVSRFGGHWDGTILRNVGGDGGIHVLEKPMIRHTNGKNRYMGVHNIQAPYPFFFEPTLHKYRLDKPKDKKGCNVFVGSMTDLFGTWVPDEWIKQVFEACEAAPQHNYMFLTKSPQRYEDMRCRKNLPERDNFWYGSTITDSTTAFWSNEKYNTFLSIEPLLAPLGKPHVNAIRDIGWVVIGAETGNRTGKIIPKREWIDEAVSGLKDYNIPVFMKDSLIPIVGEENMLREFPEGLRKDKEND